jgi:hypothetical protein
VILCESESLSSIWIASKTKGKPSLVITILSTQKRTSANNPEARFAPYRCTSPCWLDKALMCKGKTRTDKNNKRLRQAMFKITPR